MNTATGLLTPEAEAFIKGMDVRPATAKEWAEWLAGTDPSRNDVPRVRTDKVVPLSGPVPESWGLVA